jgi:hypothetical protein
LVLLETKTAKDTSPTDVLLLAAGLLGVLLPRERLPSFPAPHVRLVNHKNGHVACLYGSLDLCHDALARVRCKVGRVQQGAVRGSAGFGGVR